jgi:uncharacterized damage-inducible protein DinB
MEQTKWFDRNFDFSGSQNIFPEIIERLAGTPARLEEKLAAIPPSDLTVAVNGGWSIKEQVGHLTDLEPLWQGRLDDILSGQALLRPTDLQNAKTTLANHNATPTDQLLKDFRKIRNQTVLLIRDLPVEKIYAAAMHPRLQTPMRTMDLFLFVAEHDDHHLARITELAAIIAGRK